MSVYSEAGSVLESSIVNQILIFQYIAETVIEETKVARTCSRGYVLGP